MAMMHALLAALPVPSPSALLPRHRHSRAHPHTADAALGNFSSFKNAGISHTPIPNSTKCGQMCVLARAASAGGRDARVRANAEEDVSLALASCLEVAEDGSRYLHVMASSMHNVDNGERHSYLFLGFRSSFMSSVESHNPWLVMRFGFLSMISDEISNLCWESPIWWGAIGIDRIVGWWFLDYTNSFNFHFEFL